MILQADARYIPLANGSVHICVTSPPYWGLRDYGLDDSGIGLEKTPEEYVANIVAVFREVWRVLRDDGTLWLNLGDCYHGSGGENGNGGIGLNTAETHGLYRRNPRKNKGNVAEHAVDRAMRGKNLAGIPWRVAFALQADGWYLRSDIIWHKPNPMPESVTDRPTKSHEMLFLLAKAHRYFYDADAIREPVMQASIGRAKYEFTGMKKPRDHPSGNGNTGNKEQANNPAGRNRRDVWTIPTSPYRGAHFATFPPKLVEPCVLAGTSARGVCPECGAPWERTVEHKANYQKREATHTPNHVASKVDSTGWKPPTVTDLGWRPTCDHGAEPVPAVVLDPFCGSGTVGQVCRENGRRFVGLDLSWKYLRELAYERAETGQLAL